MPPEVPVDPTTIGTLLALFSHDLRNPLTALVANLGFLRTRPVLKQGDPVLDATLSDSLVACTALQRVIANLQVLGDSLTTSPARPHSVVASDLARDTLSALQPKADMKALTLLHEDHTAGAVLRVDRKLANLALDNLLANSLAHSSEGQTVAMHLSLTASAFVRFEIRDQGASVPNDIEPYLFDLVGQVELHRSGSRYGRGLGLWVARYAAQAVGGSVQIESPRDGSETGCTFVLELPTAAALDLET